MPKPSPKPKARGATVSRAGPKADPESKTSKRLARRTEANLTPRMREFRDQFIAEYLIDFVGSRAYLRAGGENTAQPAQMAHQLLREPYVVQTLQRMMDGMEESKLVTRNRVLAGLMREANYTAISASHGARVSAYSKLATILGLDAKQTERGLSLRGGVMIVPATESTDSWEKRAAAAQAALKEDVRK